MGKNRQDYLDGFQELKRHYCGTIIYGIEDLPFDSTLKEFKVVLERIEDILGTEDLADEHIDRIGLLLQRFETEREGKLMCEFLNQRTSDMASRFYSPSLYETIAGLMDSQEYDAAILESFKYLEKRLQTLLALSPTEYYGENLINYAFAPNSGQLQLNTNENEQRGLRNLFSGINALFRNPAAHRSLFEGDMPIFPEKKDNFASLVIAMVRVMSELITVLFGKRIDADVQAVLIALATDHSWEPIVESDFSHWMWSLLFDTSVNETTSKYRVRILLQESGKELYFRILKHKLVKPKDLEQVVSSLHNKTGIEVRLS